jgi:hypothetical protein
MTCPDVAAPFSAHFTKQKNKMGRRKIPAPVVMLDKVGWTLGTLQIEEGCRERIDCVHRVQYSDTKKIDFLHATKIAKLFLAENQPVPEHFAYVLREDYIDEGTWFSKNMNPDFFAQSK